MFFIEKDPKPKRREQRKTPFSTLPQHNPSLDSSGRLSTTDKLTPRLSPFTYRLEKRFQTRELSTAFGPHILKQVPERFSPHCQPTDDVDFDGCGPEMVTSCLTFPWNVRLRSHSLVVDESRDKLCQRNALSSNRSSNRSKGSFILAPENEELAEAFTKSLYEGIGPSQSSTSELLTRRLEIINSGRKRLRTILR